MLSNIASGDIAKLNLYLLIYFLFLKQTNPKYRHEIYTSMCSPSANKVSQTAAHMLATNTGMPLLSF